MNKCESCWNSRIVISEYGFHYSCCLSVKKVVSCLLHQKDYYIKNPNIKEKQCASNYKA